MLALSTTMTRALRSSRRSAPERGRRRRRQRSFPPPNPSHVRCTLWSSPTIARSRRSGRAHHRQVDVFGAHRCVNGATPRRAYADATFDSGVCGPAGVAFASAGGLTATARIRRGNFGACSRGEHMNAVAHQLKARYDAYVTMVGAVCDKDSSSPGWYVFSRRAIVYNPGAQAWRQHTEMRRRSATDSIINTLTSGKR